MRTEFHESVLIRRDGPFQGGLVRAEGALCPDGKRRNAWPTTDGLGDTFFSIPAFVYASDQRVYGYVTTDRRYDGDDVVETVLFRPYRYRKWHHLVEPVECPDCEGLGLRGGPNGWYSSQGLEANIENPDDYKNCPYCKGTGSTPQGPVS